MSKAPKPQKPDPQALLEWYDRHARSLPWRITPAMRAAGVVADPYRVWLSEIMLQQTTVATVQPYFSAFIDKWPTISALAAAERDDVLKAWAGLGYYSRARNLKACAELVVSQYQGRFPETVAALKKLPGIGDYTAAAITAIAFDAPANVVDGNIERIIARLFAIEETLPAARKIIKQHAATLAPEIRPGDYAQAMMDLGATLCTPKRPACALCVFHTTCRAAQNGTQEHYPRKKTKSQKPTRYGWAFVAVRADGAVLLRRRAESGLLAGMSEVPGTPWSTQKPPAPFAAAPFQAGWSQQCGMVKHSFTHFNLEVQVVKNSFPQHQPPAKHCWWSSCDDIKTEALPTVMKKIIEAALTDRPSRPIKSARHHIPYDE